MNCSAQCAWGDWENVGCINQGECEAGTLEYADGGPCGICGYAVDQRTCDEGCAWGDWQSTCVEMGPFICTPGQIQNQECSYCGTQTRSCTDECDWGPWSSCVGGGECYPGDYQCLEFGFSAGIQICANDCTWGQSAELPFGVGCSENIP